MIATIATIEIQFGAMAAIARNGTNETDPAIARTCWNLSSCATSAITPSVRMACRNGQLTA